MEGGQGSIEVSPEQATQTQQEVEQAASAAAADPELDSESAQEAEQAPAGAEQTEARYSKEEGRGVKAPALLFYLMYRTA
jgi:hypothetical protein